MFNEFWVLGFVLVPLFCFLCQRVWVVEGGWGGALPSLVNYSEIWYLSYWRWEDQTNKGRYYYHRMRGKCTWVLDRLSLLTATCCHLSGGYHFQWDCCNEEAWVGDLNVGALPITPLDSTPKALGENFYCIWRTHYTRKYFWGWILHLLLKSGKDHTPT